MPESEITTVATVALCAITAIGFCAVGYGIYKIYRAISPTSSKTSKAYSQSPEQNLRDSLMSYQYRVSQQRTPGSQQLSMDIQSFINQVQSFTAGDWSVFVGEGHGGQRFSNTAQAYTLAKKIDSQDGGRLREILNGYFTFKGYGTWGN